MGDWHLHPELPRAAPEHVCSSAVSSLADAQDAGPAPCLMLPRPGGWPPAGLRLRAAGLAGRGNQVWGAPGWNPAFCPQGCCISAPGPDSAALEGGQPCGRAGGAQPLQEESVLTSPRGLTPAGGAPALAFRLPSCVRVLSCCACPLWRGDGVGGRRRPPGVLRKSTGRCPLHLQVCDLVGLSGHLRGSQVGYQYPDECHHNHHHLHFIGDK